MVEIPVWMNSAGCSREYGLMAEPVISTRFSGTIGGPPSMGSPAPLRTCPSLRVPSGRPTSTSSPYPTHSVFSTKMSGPAISVIVRYSVGISGCPQVLEFLVHLSEGLREFFVELRFVLHAREDLAGFQRRDVLRRDVEFHRLLPKVGILLDRTDQLELPLRSAERVHGMVGVLLEEDLPDHARDLQGELLVRRQRVRPDETDDLLEFRFF